MIKTKLLIAIMFFSLFTVSSFDLATAAPKVGTGKENAPGQSKKVTTTTVPPALKFKNIATPNRHNCGVLTDGRVACWGDNFYGQVGTLPAEYVNYPISAADIASCDATVYNCSVTVVTEDAVVLKPFIIPGLSNVDRVEVSLRMSCALTGGQIYCWGDNKLGELANGTTDGLVNTTPSLIPLTGVTDFRLKQASGCAQTSDGVYCWGYNYWSIITNGAFNPGTYVLTTPTKTNLTLDQVMPLDQNLCNIQSGVIYCYGDNDYGQSGNGTINENYNYSSYTTIPTAVSNITDAILVRDGNITRCAVTAAGDAYCWGWNFYGQVGNGTAGVLDPGMDESRFSPEVGHTAPWVYTSPTKVII